MISDVIEWVWKAATETLNSGLELSKGSTYRLLLLFSCSVMSNSLWLHGLHHARLPCPSLSPEVCSNSCPLNWWNHPIISSSVIPFSTCPKSFSTSGSFPASQLFASGGQSTGASASACHSNEYSGLVSFKIDKFDLFAVQRTLKSLLQHHCLNVSIACAQPYL